MADVTRVQMGIVQRLHFRRAVGLTLVDLQKTGFTGSADDIAEECLKRLMTPSGDVAAALTAAIGTVEPTGPFLDALLQFFQQMMASSFLMTLISLIFKIPVPPKP